MKTPSGNEFISLAVHLLALKPSIRIWGSPKIRGTLLGVPRIRTIVFWGLYWGPTILGNYHMGLGLGFRGLGFRGLGFSPKTQTLHPNVHLIFHDLFHLIFRHS